MHQPSTAVRDCGRRPLRRTRYVALPPADQLAQDGREVPPARRRMVLLAGWMIRVPLTNDQTTSFEPGETICQDVAGNAFGRFEEIREAPFVVQKKIPDHQQRPA